MNKPYALALVACLGLALAASFASLSYRDRLPDPMPSHWGAGGQADGYLSRDVVLWIAPAMALGLPLLILGMTLLDFRHRDQIRQSAPAIAIMVVAFSAFFLGVHLLTLRAGLRPDHRLDEPLFIALLGALFLILGLTMGKVKINRFVGIRTPWTLHDEHVWDLTHRFAARAFAAAGLLIILMGLIAPPILGIVTVLVAVLLASLGSVLYSFVIRERAPKRAG